MENEEKEDLLLEMTESEDDPCEKEDCDCYVEEKILDFIQKEKQNHKSAKEAIVFITACLLIFLSSSVFIVVLPIYQQCSSRNGISTYSKLVTLSTTNACLFGIVHFIVFLVGSIAGRPSGIRICLPNVLKISVLLSAGTVINFWLTDGNFVSCHLQDPLKGCAVVFSFLLYFVLSRKRMSVERIFCAVTVIVGVFVTIDFGICDKFRCHGSPITLPDSAPRLHFLYIVLYIIVHGIWVLHLTYTEICWTGYQGSNTNLSLSVLSNVSRNTMCEYEKPSCQGLSVICHEGRSPDRNGEATSVFRPNSKKSFFKSKLCASNRILKFHRANSDNSLNNSVPCTNQLSVPTFKEFPITSTPVHDNDVWDSWTAITCYDIALWEHVICCFIVLSLCWLPTISFFQSGKSKLLVEVVHEAYQSFLCHFNFNGSAECNYLFIVTVTLNMSYLIFILSSLKVLKCSDSAVTVVSITTLSLPMSGLWWSIYHLNRSPPNDLLEFKPEITGEAVCAILGFPIIGVGSLLLLKSHIRMFKLSG